MAIEPRPGDWPVDGHVHFHTRARVAPTLDAAAANLGVAGGHCDGWLGALLLAEAGREAVFESLVARGEAGSWRLTGVAGEPQTLIARRDGAAIAVVCGRQVRAADGLEVLALGTLARFEDGRSLRETLDAVVRSEALAVLPWGFGKWVGPRGRDVAAALETGDVTTLFLGDNGGRLRWSGRPRLLRRGESGGFRVLSGTDPFPFGDDHRRVGSFGFRVRAEPDETSPWRGLRAWLQVRSNVPAAYGRACGPLTFLVNQAGIQAWNRLGFAGRAS